MRMRVSSEESLIRVTTRGRLITLHIQKIQTGGISLKTKESNHINYLELLAAL